MICLRYVNPPRYLGIVAAPTTTSPDTFRSVGCRTYAGEADEPDDDETLADISNRSLDDWTAPRPTGP